MNTGKQINAMVVVLFLTLLAVGAYAIWDPFRSESAEDEQLELAAERGATTFALNCRLCHGDRGEGGTDGGRLPAALALDIDRLQGIKDGAFDQVAYNDAFKLVSNTIMCGRVGTSMPVWGATQGGILNEEQIRQLAVLITYGEWEFAQEHADEIDAETAGHAIVRMPEGSLALDETELTVSDAAAFTAGQYIRIQDERLRILPKSLEVERGVDGTEAAAHERGDVVLSVDVDTGEEVVTGHALAEDAEADDTALVVHDPAVFTVGETLRLGDEKVRVTGFITGVPTTGQRLAKEIGREPKKLLVSGTAGIEVGQLIRLQGELMEVKAISDDGDPGIVLEEAASATDARIAVSDPVFFSALWKPKPPEGTRSAPREGYLVRVGDELMEVVGPVDTEQTLGDTIGRAQTKFAVSGTEGIETGMVIRLGEELMRVAEIVEPTRVEVEREAKDAAGTQTTAAPHPAGTLILRPVAPAEGEEPAEPVPPEDTGQTLLEGANSAATTLVVSGTARISTGETYLLGEELVVVKDVQPAVIRVDRGVEDTERGEHPRRGPIFVGNLVDVERGADGTAASAHDAGDSLLLGALEVERGAQGSELADHSKNAEIYLGRRLIVQRGVLEAEAADHPNGELVRDFPFAGGPEDPTRNDAACGQIAAAPSTPSGPGPTPVEGPDVAVSLAEWSVTADPASIAATAANFIVTNDGTTVHNFRVIATDLAPDALPLDAAGLVADEGQVEVVGGFTAGLQGGNTQTAPVQLAPGAYVLICNVPTHYEQGMYTAFEVTAP